MSFRHYRNYYWEEPTSIKMQLQRKRLPIKLMETRKKVFNILFTGILLDLSRRHQLNVTFIFPIVSSSSISFDVHFIDSVHQKYTKKSSKCNMHPHTFQYTQFSIFLHLIWQHLFIVVSLAT